MNLKTGSLAGLALAVIAALALYGQNGGQAKTWEVGATVLPTSSTNPCGAGYFGAPVCNQTLHLDSMTLVNHTSNPITVYIQAANVTSDCSAVGGQCYLFAGQIAGNDTTYTVPLLGERAAGGFLWYATATGLNGWISGH